MRGELLAIRASSAGGRAENKAHRRQGDADDDEEKKEAPADADTTTNEALALADALVSASGARGLEVGHATVRKIRWALAHLGLVFTDQQTQFHDMMLFATLPHLFGAEWDANEAQILAYYGRERHAPRVAMSMPRSGGKTMALTAFLGAFMWAMVDRGLSVVCFSIQKDQAHWVMLMTYTFLSRLPGGADMCHTRGAELLVSRKSREKADTTATKLRAQSGNAAGGRGLQPHVVILEEAAFISPDLYFETIMPMFAHRGRTVIAISSPCEAGGIFASLFTMRFETTNEPVFETVKDQNICDACLLARRMTCPHVVTALPPWKTEKQKELLRLLYRNYPERFAKEVEGAMGATEAPVFAPARVDAMFALKVTATQTVPFLFLSVDPAAGGKGSDTAWTTLFFDHRDKCVITGCGAVNMTGALIADEVNAMIAHIREVRRQPHLASAVVVIIVEANLDFVRAKEIALALMARLDRIEQEATAHGLPQRRGGYIYSHDNSGHERPGIWLDNGMKHKYVNRMLQFMQCDAIGLHDPFVGTEEDINEMRRQLIGFRQIFEESKTPFTKPRSTFSGKASGKDDRVISILMGLYHGTLFFQRPKPCETFKMWPRVIDGTGALRPLAITGGRTVNPALL